MTLQIRAIPRPQSSFEWSRLWSTMTLQIRAIPRPAGGGIIQDPAEYHDITNPGNPQTQTSSPIQLPPMYHDITNPGNPQTVEVEGYKASTFVPWHYKSGQSPDGIWGIKEVYPEVPWHYKSGQSPDYNKREWTLGFRYHDITNPGNPQTLKGDINDWKGSVPWHYKSGQSPDVIGTIADQTIDEYHDITNPGNPQTTSNCHVWYFWGSTMTLQIRAIPRPLELI